MLYYDFDVGETTYKLALSTKATCDLEKKIGCNPLAIFGTDGTQVPTVTTMVSILWASLQKYEHGISQDKVFDIFDNWLADGHTVTEFVQVILDIYNVSGLIKYQTVEDSEKN